jgi:hypothetical protein
MTIICLGMVVAVNGQHRWTAAKETAAIGEQNGFAGTVLARRDADEQKCLTRVLNAFGSCVEAANGDGCTIIPCATSWALAQCQCDCSYENGVTTNTVCPKTAPAQLSCYSQLISAYLGGPIPSTCSSLAPVVCPNGETAYVNSDVQQTCLANAGATENSLSGVWTTCLNSAGTKTSKSSACVAKCKTDQCANQCSMYKCMGCDGGCGNTASFVSSCVASNGGICLTIPTPPGASVVPGSPSTTAE